jgi:pyruvate,water dikinase
LEVSGLDVRVRKYFGSFENLDGARLAEFHQQLGDALLAVGLPERVKEELATAVEPFLKPELGGLAVRSSAVYEDSQAASFAGVFDSFVGVTDLAQCEQRILQCWISSWSPRALRYLKRMGIEPRTDAMAVILQPTVSAISSGVVYTADPDTGNPWEFVARATLGLSVDLMSGSGVGDTFRVEWDTGSILNREIVSKSSSIVATQDGIECHTLSTSARNQAALADHDIAALSAAARQLDEAFGLRLDIEFVFAPDGLWIVQARPLTALPPFFPHELPKVDENKTWVLAKHIVPLRADLPSGMITPLYADFSDAEMWGRYQPDDIVLGVLCTDVRDVHGYRYMLPSQRMFAHCFASPSEYEAWLDQNEPTYRERWDRYSDELAEIARIASTAIQGTTSAADLIPEALRTRDKLWDLNSFAWSGPQWLGWMCEMLLSHFVKEFDPEFESGPLIGGGMDSYTFRVTQALQLLGRTVHEAEVREAFETLPLNQVLPYLCKTHPSCEFLRQFELFCWRFGKTPLSWQDRPPFWNSSSENTALTHTVRCALQGISREVETAQRESRVKRDEIESDLRGKLAHAMPERLSRFDKMLEWARYWGQALNDRHELSAGLLWERELIWQVGERLRGEGVFNHAEEVLTLRREDLERFLSEGTSQSFRQLVAERRWKVQSSLRLKPPATLGAQESSAPVAPASVTDDSHTAGNEFIGKGIGSSDATGIARHVTDLSDPELLDMLKPEDVLVLPYEQAFHYADWHSILTLVTAVVSPGQPSHHLAQVARECGVPVIGHVRGDLSDIKDGVRLHIAPRAGMVRILDS